MGLARARSDPGARRRCDRWVSGSGSVGADRRHDRADPRAARANAGGRELVEEPSPAQLAVLRGLAAGLSRREIGAQLYISLNTVKTHTRELYQKLGATWETEAVARAEALGLFGAG